MTVRVRTSGDGYVIDGQREGCAAANTFLKHLAGRGFSAAKVRANAFDELNLARFLLDRDLGLAVTPVTVFEWIGWQDVRRETRPGTARRIGRGIAASTINRRVAEIRALFEYLVMTGVRGDNPVPSRTGGRLVRQPRLPLESLNVDAAGQFVAPLRTHRDRAMGWTMLFGGLRSADVQSLRLADVDSVDDGCGCSAKARRNVWCRSIRCSSPNYRPICASNGPLAATQSIPPSSRRAYRNRIAGMRQMLFQARIIDTPPRRRRWARSYTQRFAEAPMADAIRETLLRYVTVRAAVLRPKSVKSLINDLLLSRTTSPPPIPTSSHSRIWIAVTSRGSWSGTTPAAGVGNTPLPGLGVPSRKP